MKTKLSKIEEKEFSYIINVVASAANNTQIPIPFAGINWQNIISNVRYCGLSAIFANTVLGLPNSYIPDSVRSNLIGIKGTELLLDTNLNYEIEKLLKTFDKYKIKNAPVKGYFLKKSIHAVIFAQSRIMIFCLMRNSLTALMLHLRNLDIHFCAKTVKISIIFKKSPICTLKCIRLSFIIMKAFIHTFLTNLTKQLNERVILIRTDCLLKTITFIFLSIPQIT